MKPKEKAEELVSKYRDTIMSFLSDNMKDMNAKKCALLAVDEIEWIVEDDEDKWNFWQQVKQEIKLL